MKVQKRTSDEEVVLTLSGQEYKDLTSALKFALFSEEGSDASYVAAHLKEYGSDPSPLVVLLQKVYSALRMAEMSRR